MAYKLTKKFPQDFAEDISKVADALTLEHGERPFLYGSGSYKIDYPSDYDLAQEVPVSKYILSDLQAVVKRVMKMEGVYIGDIKSGEIPSFKVVDEDTNEKNYNSRRPKMLTKIKSLYKKNTRKYY